MSCILLPPKPSGSSSLSSSSRFSAFQRSKLASITGLVASPRAHLPTAPRSPPAWAAPLCGSTDIGDEDIEGYVEMQSVPGYNNSEFFALRLSGNSMSPEDRNAQELLKEFMAKTANDKVVVAAHQRALVGEIAERFRPMYEASGGKRVLSTLHRNGGLQVRNYHQLDRHRGQAD